MPALEALREPLGKRFLFSLGSVRLVGCEPGDTQSEAETEERGVEHVGLDQAVPEACYIT